VIPGTAAGPLFGFPAGPAFLGPPRAGGNGADEFPGIGSPFGSILPGVVLQTTILVPVTGGPGKEVPTSFTVAPSYLPDAPFINRTYGESSFSTYSAGLKWRFTGVNNPLGIGLIAFYRFYADDANDFSGFNQLQRGSSRGDSKGDIGLVLFADARLARWANFSANFGYNWNSDVRGEFANGKFTLLDTPNELMGAVGIDFPVNRYFQPIFELRATRYVGGRTPNSFPQNPVDGIAGFRVYPARWLSIGAAYRYNFNEQDEGYFDEDQLTNQTVNVICFDRPVVNPTGQTGPSPCINRVVTPNFTGRSSGICSVARSAWIHSSAYGRTPQQASG
jgi:hypothetical protein